jgi:hypothetical protein
MYLPYCCRLISLVAAAAHSSGGAGCCSRHELHPATAAWRSRAEQRRGCGDGSVHRITRHWALLQPGLGLNQPAPSCGHWQHLVSWFTLSAHRNKLSERCVVYVMQSCIQQTAATSSQMWQKQTYNPTWNSDPLVSSLSSYRRCLAVQIDWRCCLDIHRPCSGFVDLIGWPTAMGDGHRRWRGSLCYNTNVDDHLSRAGNSCCRCTQLWRPLKPTAPCPSEGHLAYIKGELEDE